MLSSSGKCLCSLIDSDPLNHNLLILAFKLSNQSQYDIYFLTILQLEKN